jgi:hypothetical protein
MASFDDGGYCLTPGLIRPGPLLSCTDAPDTFGIDDMIARYCHTILSRRYRFQHLARHGARVKGSSRDIGFGIYFLDSLRTRYQIVASHGLEAVLNDSGNRLTPGLVRARVLLIGGYVPDTCSIDDVEIRPCHAIPRAEWPQLC